MAAFVKVWDDRRAILTAVVNTARYLNEKAVVIQKNYRAYRGRDGFRKHIKNFLKAMKDQRYHIIAVKIQSIWRSYYVRKYIFSYYSYKEYLIGLMHKNSLVMSTLQHLEHCAADERLKREKEIQEIQDYEDARCHHYMLSTKTNDGVFKTMNSCIRPSFEDCMKRIQFTCASKENKSKKNKTVHLPVTVVKSEDKMTESLTLPPLMTKGKIQGPFKPCSVVLKKRNIPFNPTLRVATAYDSEEVARSDLKAEEWRNRVHDERFLPFTKLEHQYQPSVHTKSRYINSMHQFREEQSYKHVSKKRFTTVVPPIPLFEQL